MTHWWATADWQTAYATWALFAVTLCAVVVGGAAAISASRAYALEAVYNTISMRTIVTSSHSCGRV